MVQITDKEKCCGCWACENVCPKQCITMIEDEEGFRYPKVDMESCVDCHLCENVCPIRKPVLAEDRIPYSFVIQHKDNDILMSSTSGGFFTAIAKYVIDKGGVVFGVAFDDDMVLRHQIAYTLKECERFRGSKYVQSIIGDSYSKCKEILKQNKYVLFSGTGCQISGLYSYLQGVNLDKLITVDLVCHGVPSPKLFMKFINAANNEYKSKAVNYLSRDKYYGYYYGTATIKFENENISYHKDKNQDFMLSAYFKGLCSRPSCYKCHFRTINRISDFTIFDCWNAKSISDVFSDEGATNVFVHSKKGKVIFDGIKDLFLYHSTDLCKILKTDGDMVKSNPLKHPLRELFFEDLLNGMSISELKNKYLKIGFLKRNLLFLKPMFYKLGLWNLYMKMK